MTLHVCTNQQTLQKNGQKEASRALLTGMEYAMASAALMAATGTVGLADTVRSFCESNEMNMTVSVDLYK